MEVSGKNYTFVLKKLSDIPISRHVKIKKEANPFDSAWYAYFGKRHFERLKVRLLRQQFIGSTHYGGVAPV
jgi:RNA-directed DNA polymerase